MVTAQASGKCGYIDVWWSTGNSEMCSVISSGVVLSYWTGQQLKAKKSLTLHFIDSLDYVAILYLMSQYLLAVQRMSLGEILQILHLQELRLWKVCNMYLEYCNHVIRRF